jgi:hypothetical protein
VVGVLMPLPIPTLPVDEVPMPPVPPGTYSVWAEIDVRAMPVAKSDTTKPKPFLQESAETAEVFLSEAETERYMEIQVGLLTTNERS